MTPQSKRLPAFQAEQAIRLARETLDIEAAAVLGLQKHLGSAFAEAVEMILKAIEKAGYFPSKDCCIALDPAASSFYKKGKYYLAA